MSTITTRSGKGAALTNNEVDSNFTNLNTDKLESGDLSVTTATASGSGSLSYNSTVFTFTPPDLSGYVVDLSAFDTDDLSEGSTNLYFTNERVDDRVNSLIQAGLGITTSYDDVNGELTIESDTIEENCKNATASTILKGTPVYQTGTSGNFMEIAPADASNASKMPAVGVLAEDLTAGSEGTLLLMGRISGINTSAFSEGDVIYVASGGGYTNTRPTGESVYVQNLGRVTKVDSSNGGGVVMGSGRVNDIPNLGNGKIFIGNGVDAYEQRTPVVADISDLTATAAELNYTDGVTSNIQTQLDNKQPLSAVLTATTASFTTADETKLDGIEAGATADQTASEILTAIKTVDGAGSGLDADLLDGQEGSYYTNYADTAVANLVDSAPGTLDTLNELAAALGDDPNFATTVTNSIATKAPLASPTFTGTVTIPTADINGGNIDGTTIGGTTPAAGSFTTLETTGDITTGGSLIVDSNSVTTQSDIALTANVAINGENSISFGLTDNVNGYYRWLFGNTSNTGGTAGGVEKARLDKDGNLTLSGDITVTGTVDGRDVAADGTKLDGIESGATGDQTASEILTAIKTVDGAGSGLDADLLDGYQPSTAASNNTIVRRNSSGYVYANYFNTSPNTVTSGVTQICVETGNDGFIRHGTAAAVRSFLNVEDGATGDQTASEILTAIKTVDGSGSGLDADTVDGLQASSFLRSDADDSTTGNLTVGGDLIATDLLPPTDNTGEVGTATYTWNNGRFTNFYIDSTLTVRSYIDLADSDGIRFGSSDDSRFWYNGSTNKFIVEMETACVGYQWTDNQTERMYLEKSTGNLNITGNLDIGTYSTTNSGTLYLNGTTANKRAQFLCTNGNLHIDSDVSTGIYLNWFYGNHTVWGVGGQAEIARLDSDFFKHNSDVRTPIFYDSDNTAYYLDPSVNSNLNAVYTAESFSYGWFRNMSSGYGIYNQVTGQHFYSDDDDYWNIAGGTSANGLRFRDEYGGTIRGYVYADNSNNIGFLNNGAGWRARVVGGDYFLVEGSSSRAPLFYDSNNTGYYINPNSASRLAVTTVTNYIDIVYSLTGTSLDPGAGNIQYKTVSANTTFSDTLASGESMVLQLTNAGNYTITWPTITWTTSNGNTAPTLTTNDTLVFWKIGSTLYGAYVGSGA